MLTLPANVLTRKEKEPTWTTHVPVGTAELGTLAGGVVGYASNLLLSGPELGWNEKLFDAFFGKQSVQRKE